MKEAIKMSETHPILKNYALFGIIFTFVMGSLFHFIYDLSGSATLVGYFFPINESVWEHLKLGFYTWLVYGISNYFFLNDKVNNYWIGIFFATLAMNLFIIIFFYTYTGIFGHSILALDIGSYLVGCIVAAYVYYRILVLPPISTYGHTMGLLLLLLNIVLFAMWTYHPPKLPLFEDPTTHPAVVTSFSSTTL